MDTSVVQVTEQSPPGEQDETEENRKTQKSGPLKSLQDLSILLDEEENNTYGISYNDLHNDSYIVTGLMMYLIGVEKRHFDSYQRDLTGDYEKYNQNKEARIIRNLCRIRTAFERHWVEISNRLQYDLVNISSMPELIPADAVEGLAADGIVLYESRPDNLKYMLSINKYISEHISNVKSLFPDWIQWEFIRPLFIMPDGLKEEGIIKEGKFYNTDRNRYPYQCYMNWHGPADGNLLYSDKKFVHRLYEMHGTRFEDKSLLTDVGNIIKDDMYDFLARNEKTVIVVDCENSDPIKLAAALSSLSPVQRSKIHKLMMFDSNYTTATWNYLCQHGIRDMYEMTHVIVDRMYEHKSQVDMTLAAETCREVYQNGVDSVILVSSDSDYWALIRSLRDIEFLVMLEHEKSGKTITDALEEQQYRYCFLDDFCTGASYSIKTSTLCQEIQQRLDKLVSFNINELLEEVIHGTWIEMTEKEKANFFDRYLKDMRLQMDSGGNVRAVLAPD